MRRTTIFDFSYLVRFVQVFARTARHPADTKQLIEWTAGDHSEAAGGQLYGLP